MEHYKNLGGNSDVSAYEIGSDSITVQFKGGKNYQYTYASAGKSNIEQMKSLAIAGRGLNSFIMKYTRTSYASKF